MSNIIDTLLILLTRTGPLCSLSKTLCNIYDTHVDNTSFLSRERERQLHERNLDPKRDTYIAGG